MSAADRVASLLPGRADYARLRTSWRADLLSGLTVGIVALPLALGFGVSSGAGAEAGLVTAIIAGVVAAVFGGSNVQVSGPTGAMVVVLAPIVAQYGTGALGAVCVIAGILVALAGALRLGRAVGLLPWPVIEGFTLGIAATIFLQQLPQAVGLSAHGLSSNAAVAAAQAIARAQLPTVLWSLAVVVATALVMLAAPKVIPVVPGSIVAIIVVSGLTVLLRLPVAKLGALPAGLPAPRLPGFDLATISHLALPAITVAALAAIESLLSARVAASISDTGPYNADRELVGQGLASIVAGFFGGMPATGAIARTAVNVRSGAQTRVAAIVHAAVLLVIVVAASHVVALIPLAALGGVLMVTAVRMVSPRTVRAVIRSSRSDAAVFWITAVITVSVDLIYAVGAGLVIAAAVALRNVARSAGAQREALPGGAAPGDERIALFRIDGALFFGAAERVLDQISAISDVDVVILRLSQIRYLDATGAQFLTELVQRLERRGITVLVKGIQAQHLGLAERVGVIAALRHHKHLFDELPPAVEHARSHVARATTAY
ncbi:SulP family inorganic anion transporter [Gryllotalpicola protaetiae]|uniref:SulP family inorganic anion transporter n=1 Tax=Gryllotalpicola protaetiae TaxID=2419771 RepID=A0A387BVM6_9MICO|nr:SulP family inorganic anion transporter [Gryllotalpicola protaetiae]AYG02431.1 SulP family inorganic anion transporter [Gryllotalpicola protaetiae]